jgi:hypothetical protein
MRSQTEGRGSVIPKARTQAEASGIALDTLRGVSVWIYPPPSDAGAHGHDSLFDKNGWHGFYCHELGHMLGMDHPMGPAGVYDDPYCVMGNAVWNRALPADPDFAALPVPSGFWMGPRMASAANMYRVWEKESAGQGMVQTGYSNQAFQTDLVGLSEASRGERILVAVSVQPGTYFAEYRTATRWDSDITPAVVIHSRDIRPNPLIRKDDGSMVPAGEVRPVFYEGAILQPFDEVYRSPRIALCSRGTRR